MNELEDFKSFAREVFGEELSPIQLKMYEAVKDKKSLLFMPRKTGITYFNKMWLEFNKRKKVNKS